MVEGGGGGGGTGKEGHPERLGPAAAPSKTSSTDRQTDRTWTPLPSPWTPLPSPCPGRCRHLCLVLQQLLRQVHDQAHGRHEGEHGRGRQQLRHQSDRRLQLVDGLHPPVVQRPRELLQRVVEAAAVVLVLVVEQHIPR